MTFESVTYILNLDSYPLNVCSFMLQRPVINSLLSQFCVDNYYLELAWITFGLKMLLRDNFHEVSDKVSLIPSKQGPCRCEFPNG